MSGPTLLTFLALLLALVGLLVVGWLLLQRLRRGAADAGRELAAELAADRPLHGPEMAEYAGGTADVLRGRSRGALVLTESRLLFRELSGPGLEVPLAGLSVEVAAEYDGLRRLPQHGRRTQPDVPPAHLVVRTQSSTAGFAVEDPEAWRAAVERAAGDPAR